MTAETRRERARAEAARSAANRHAEATKAMNSSPDTKGQFGAAIDYFRSIARLLTPAERTILFRTGARLLVEETAKASRAITKGGDR